MPATNRPANDTRSHLSTTERAAALRGLLKTRLGLTARDVSVRSDCYSMGSTIHVTIKIPHVQISRVTEIAKAFESVSRCAETGEVLSGGNTHVEVEYSDEALLPLRTQFEGILATVKVGETYSFRGLTVVSDSDGYWFLSVGQSPRVRCWGASNCARQMAEAVCDSLGSRVAA